MRTWIITLGEANKEVHRQVLSQLLGAAKADDNADFIITSLELDGLHNQGNVLKATLGSLLAVRKGNVPFFSGAASGRGSELSVFVVGFLNDTATCNLFLATGVALRILFKSEELAVSSESIDISGFLLTQGNSLQDQNEKTNQARFIGEMHTCMSSENVLVANRPFNRIVFFSNNNRLLVDNPLGFQGLTDKQLLEGAGQIMLDFYLGGTAALNNNYYTAGAFGIFYDINYDKSKLGLYIGEKALDEFKNSESSPWFDPNTSERLLNDYKVPDSFSHISVFKILAKKLQENEIRNRLLLHKEVLDFNAYPSPYDFLNLDLLKIYFGIRVKTLPLKLVEYSRMYLKKCLTIVDETLDTESREILDSNTELRQPNSLNTIIKNTATAIWHNAHYTHTGLKQFESILNRFRKIIADEMTHLRLFRAKNFVYDEGGKPTDFNIFYVPKELEEFFKDYQKEFLESSEVTQQILTKEKELIDKLTKTLQRHPIPLALLAKSLLNGLLLSVLSVFIVKLFPDSIIDVSTLKQKPWIYVVCFLAFFLPFGRAWWRYQVQTLNRIRKISRRYVALILFMAHKQTLDRLDVFLKEIYNKCSSYCDDLLSSASETRKSLTLHAPRVSPFIQTVFQKELTGEVEGKKIIRHNPVYEVSVNNTPVSSLEIDTTRRYRILSTDVIRALSIWKTMVLEKKFTGASSQVSEYFVNHESSLFVQNGNQNNIRYWLLDYQRNNIERNFDSDSIKQIRTFLYPSYSPVSGYNFPLTCRVSANQIRHEDGIYLNGYLGDETNVNPYQSNKTVFSILQYRSFEKFSTIHSPFSGIDILLKTYFDGKIDWEELTDYCKLYLVLMNKEHSELGDLKAISFYYPETNDSVNIPLNKEKREQLKHYWKEITKEVPTIGQKYDNVI